MRPNCFKHEFERFPNQVIVAELEVAAGERDLLKLANESESDEDAQVGEMSAQIRVLDLFDLVSHENIGHVADVQLRHLDHIHRVVVCFCLFTGRVLSNLLHR